MGAYKCSSTSAFPSATTAIRPLPTSSPTPAPPTAPSAPTASIPSRDLSVQPLEQEVIIVVPADSDEPAATISHSLVAPRHHSFFGGAATAISERIAEWQMDIARLSAQRGLHRQGRRHARRQWLGANAFRLVVRVRQSIGVGDAAAVVAVVASAAVAALAAAVAVAASVGAGAAAALVGASAGAEVAAAAVGWYYDNNRSG